MLDSNLAKELDAAVEQAVEHLEELNAAPNNDDPGNTAAANVGAGAVVGEVGVVGDAGTDGAGAVAIEEEGAGEGNGQPSTVNAGAASATVQVPLSDAVLTAAVQHGIPLEDARLFPSESALNRAIGAVRKSIEQFAPKDEKKAEEEDLLAKLAGVDITSFDEDVQSVLNPVLDIIKKQQEQLKELRTQTEQYNANSTQAQQNAAQREITEWFDGQITKLGDDFKDVLGVGGTDALSLTSQQKAKRDAIANQAAILFAGYNATGIALESRDGIFAQAARMALADDYAKLAEKKLTSNLQKRSKQHIQRAGGNQKTKSNGDVFAETVEELKRQFPKLA